MQTVLVNYADRRFRGRQRMNAYTAIVRGRVDRCVRYDSGDLDRAFVDEHSYLLSVARGAGYWLWKPQIILDAMARTADEDVIIYSDAGGLFRASVAPLVDVSRSLKDGILGFGVGKDFIERHWTKRDAFVLMECDSPEFWDTEQLLGGFVVLVNRPASRAFVREWADLVCRMRLVSDMPSVCAEPELEGFRAHRHDQSIFSLLYKKRGYESYGALTGKGIGGIVEAHILFEPSWFTMVPAYLHPGMYRRAATNMVSSGARP